MEFSDFDVCSDQKLSDPRSPETKVEQGLHYVIYRYDRDVAFVARDRNTKKLFLIRESRHRAFFKSTEDAQTELRQALKTDNFEIPAIPAEDTATADLHTAFKKALCRHFVALNGTWCANDSSGAPTGDYKHYCFSAFVCKWGDAWMIVTAGHAIKDFVDDVKAQRATLGSQWVIDYFGEGVTSKTPIPFNIMDHLMHYVHDEEMGLDCAIIILWWNDVELLEKNGIKALSPMNWVIPEGVQVTGHVLLGLPEERTHTVDRGDKIVGYVKPLIIPIRRVKDDTSHEFTRFHAIIDDIEPFSTIIGMSGGPIFACAENDEETHYYLVAVQSGWEKSTRDLYGCPFDPFMRHLIVVMLNSVDRETE